MTTPLFPNVPDLKKDLSTNVVTFWEEGSAAWLGQRLVASNPSAAGRPKPTKVTQKTKIYKNESPQEGKKG
jgi:hypothetical protein